MCTFVLLFAVLLVTVQAAIDNENASCWNLTPWFDRADWTACQAIPTTEDDEPMFLFTRPMEDSQTLMMGLYAPANTYGWTALAMAGNGGMKGASHIVVRRINDEWIAEDRYSHTFAQPSLDDQQDVQLVFAHQDNGETAWAVLVPYEPCDERNYALKADLSRYMLWAVGASHEEFSYHVRRGQFHATLISTVEDEDQVAVQQAAENDKEDSHVVDLRMPDIAIHQTEAAEQPETNPYICTMFDLNQVAPAGVSLEQGVHITQLEPLLDGPGKDYVHHMILYACDDDNGDNEFEHLQVIPDCQNMPRGCSEMKWPWAVGGQGQLLPPHVGLPLGGASAQNQNPFVVLQVHYYNPQLHTDVVDNSGVRVHFTTQLRPQEAGYLVLNGGAAALQRPPLPPGQADYALSPFVVPSSCTTASWASPLHLLGVAHHMHFAGLSMNIIVHDTSGAWRGSLRHEKLYDFNHQSMEQSLIETLQPGDEITVHCHYDTTSSTKNVAFGEATTDEMCYSAILYYPLQRRSTYHYVPVLFDHSLCSKQATGEEFVGSDNEDPVSACAQTYVENFPRFLGLEHVVPVPFGALQMCNSDLFPNSIQSFYPQGCPNCYQTKSCTLQDLVAHGQTVACPFECNAVGLSVYPDTSQTQLEYNHGVRGCAGGGTQFVHLEERHEQEHPSDTCIPRGDLSQDIQLAGMDNNPTNGSSSSNHRHTAMSYVGSALLVALLFLEPVYMIF